MRVMHTTQLAIYISLFLFSCIVIADQNDPLEIINLNSRRAEEIIPIIKPVLKPNDSITGTGIQIFLRTDANTLVEVKRLLNVVDKAPQNLIITVSNNINTSSKSTELDVSVNYEIGEDGRVVVGEQAPRKEGLRAHANKDENTQKNDFRHTIRVLDGNSAYIASGEVRPYEHTIIYGSDDGLSTYSEIDEQDVSSGFYVTPRLTGDNQVSLRIQPHYRHIKDNYSESINTQEADTVITANLDQWVQIAVINEDANLKNTQILSVARENSHKESTIYIKVEVE